MANISSVSDIFNRPPDISEDTLQYTLYPPDGFNDRASVTAYATLMRSYVESLLPGHLWHRDPFELKVVKYEASEGWKLEGRMRVGDCVDDEWCAVWLLKEISAKWDVAISVIDSDGEFLLIEAADALPSWVTPTNAENRVWIYQARLHLIPLSYVSAPSSRSRSSRHPNDDNGGLVPTDDVKDYISVPDALGIVRDPLIDTIARPAVEKIVWKRISAYPAAARQHVHVTKAYLPTDIAKALAVDPSLIQKPVETFYTRDALQLRVVHKMSRFPPEPSVLTSVKMTRTAYAQLVGQRFYPPKIFGRWREREGTKEWRWRDIGMKIACGFEMTYQESKGRTESSRLSAEAIESSAATRKEILRRSPEYAQYIRNLASSGYFEGELEGSLMWNTLEHRAADVFLDARREDDASRISFAASVNSALARAGNVSLLSASDEDSDSWLNVDAETFDSALERSFNTREVSSSSMDVDETSSIFTEATKLQAAHMHSFAKKVEEFVETEGDVRGARFTDEQFSDEDSSIDDGSRLEDESRPGSPSEVRDGAAAVDEAQRQADMAQLVPPLDPSEYGKMPPSYYANSQRVAPVTMDTEIRDEISSESAASSALRQRAIRPPIIPRDNYDGVDSDDETDEESGDEEDKPQVVGDIEMNMEEEEEEFLEFARQVLGVSDDQWGHIIREREGRGAYVPSPVLPSGRRTSAIETGEPHINDTTTRSSSQDMPTSDPHADASHDLNTFEAAMQAMDAELLRVRSRKDCISLHAAPADKDKGKTAVSAEQNLDIEGAMDAELREALEAESDCGDDDGADQGQLDYELIKNFLESFKSQGGLPGPVGNLAGRLQPGWTLPRDDS